MDHYFLVLYSEGRDFIEQLPRIVSFSSCVEVIEVGFSQYEVEEKKPRRSLNPTQMKLKEMLSVAKAVQLI